LQTPEASQVFVAPAQLSGSSAPITATQAPPPPVQAWQVPQALVVQQCPSTQLPVEQSVPAPQVCPGLALQVPLASQVRSVAQVSASSALTTGTQVPFAPVQA
jgi:hypothetical protein